MVKFSYKKYAKEVVETLFDIDDVDIYEKFLKEFIRLTNQERYKKEERKCCATCFNGYAGYCEEKKTYVNENDICDEYESSADAYEEIRQMYRSKK